MSQRERNQFNIHITKTVWHKNIKMRISISVTYKLKVWNQDFNQEYIQAHYLQIYVYVTPDPKSKLLLSTIIKVFKPLYGLTESGGFWFKSYTSSRKKRLWRKHTNGDLSLFYHNVSNTLHELLAVYMDDTLASGINELIKITNKIPEKFESRPREFPPLLFSELWSTTIQKYIS